MSAQEGALGQGIPPLGRAYTTAVTLLRKGQGVGELAEGLDAGRLVLKASADHVIYRSQGAAKAAPPVTALVLTEPA